MTSAVVSLERGTYAAPLPPPLAVRAAAIFLCKQATPHFASQYCGSSNVLGIILCL